MSNAKSIAVKLLGKEYQVVCPNEQERDLVDAAYYLDKKMIEIRNSGRVIGLERIAIMAALNLAHDLLEQHIDKQESMASLSKHLERLQNKIDCALTKEQVNAEEVTEV
jgi:cell division protein ZapA